MASGDVRPLLAPFELGAVPLRNRVFVPGHTTNFGWDNRPTRRHVAYHAERARGGAGLIDAEGARIFAQIQHSGRQAAGDATRTAAWGPGDVPWTPFDERRDGLRPDGWGERGEWHFPWAVLSATKPAAPTRPERS